MVTLAWIVTACLAMSALALVGLVSVLLSEARLRVLLLPLVAFAAGSLMGGALLHLVPEAVGARGADVMVFSAMLAGFSLFFLLEQLVSWHHDHIDAPPTRTPVSYLILLADGLHNFIGGLAIAASFLVSVDVGIITWLAAAAHEVPQELGDFAILRRGGWPPRQALAANLASALTILPGGLVAYAVSADIDTALLLAFAAGNFVYIAASDLVPEVKQDRGFGHRLTHVVAFAAGVGVIALTRALAVG
ncbi:MAG: ZIP family metal transporter [Vicinamibacterales bacterium]